MAIRSRDLQPDMQTLDDVELAGHAARGDAAAFEVLYQRHVDAAWRVANVVAGNDHDAADAVSEAFARLLHALADGRLSPEVPFRPYLLAATRNAAIDQHRRAGRDRNVIDLRAPADDGVESVDRRMEAGAVGAAFRELPERWRSVLWLTEVEGLSATDAGARMGLTPNGAAQLAHRARNGLRARYLRTRLASTPRPECTETLGVLAAWSAGTLSPRAAARVDQHLAGCATCREAASLDDAGDRLKALVPPIPIALAGLAMGRYKEIFSSGRRLLRGGERMTRSLAVTASALLALGVITAGLMSNGGGPGTLPNSRGAGTLAIAPATSVSQLPGTGATTTAPAGTTNEGTGTGGQGSGGPASGGPIVADVAPPAAQPAPPPPPPPVSRPTPSGPPPPPKPTSVVAVGVGANVSVASTSASVAVGGTCTGVSTSGSCAPPAPAQPGVSLSVQTPLGSTSAAKPSVAPGLGL